jgi:hypothetical protein
MDTIASWRAKMSRAEKHLADLDDMLTNYVRFHPYRAHGRKPPDKHPTKWSFTLAITQQPDPMFAVVLGDLLFDARSALDHIAVAIAPKNRQSSAGFPIFDEDPFLPGAKPGKQEKFLSLTKGMPDEAVAIITREQPYDRQRRGIYSSDDPDTLQVLSALQNADKHRNLSVITLGLINPRVTLRWPPQRTSTITRVGPYMEAGAELANWKNTDGPVMYDDVDVQVHGTPKVGVMVSRQGPYELLGDGSVGQAIIIRVTRILDRLEPHVRI